MLEWYFFYWHQRQPLLLQRYLKIQLTQFTNCVKFTVSKNTVIRSSKLSEAYREPAVGESRLGMAAELAFE
jgi:hypothetical protein